MDYSFELSPSYDLSYNFSSPDMSVGTAGYYTPPTDFSGGTSQMSYAGGQNYAGDSGEWGASGAYCADSYSSYMSAQYGALGDTLAAQQLNVFRNPVPSWYPDDGSLQYAQYGFTGLAVGSGLGAVYLGAAAAAPLVYAYGSDLLGMTAATSPELVAGGAGLGAYAVENAPELDSLAAEGVSRLVYGPSGGGDLAATAARLGGQTLTDFVKPTELGWEAFSTQTLDAAAASGRQVIFDLTNMQNIPGVLSGTGQFANTVTGAELRYIQSNWAAFQSNVTFMSGGAIVEAPW